MFLGVYLVVYMLCRSTPPRPSLTLPRPRHTLGKGDHGHKTQLGVGCDVMSRSTCYAAASLALSLVLPYLFSPILSLAFVQPVLLTTCLYGWRLDYPETADHINHLICRDRQTGSKESTQPDGAGTRRPLAWGRKGFWRLVAVEKPRRLLIIGADQSSISRARTEPVQLDFPFPSAISSQPENNSFGRRERAGGRRAVVL